MAARPRRDRCPASSPAGGKPDHDHGCAQHPRLPRALPPSGRCPAFRRIGEGHLLRNLPCCSTTAVRRSVTSPSPYWQAPAEPRLWQRRVDRQITVAGYVEGGSFAFLIEYSGHSMLVHVPSYVIGVLDDIRLRCFSSSARSRRGWSSRALGITADRERRPDPPQRGYPGQVRRPPSPAPAGRH